MIEEPAKLTICKPKRRPTAAQIAAFKDIPTGFVVDAMGGRGALAWDVKPLWDVHVAGPALTVGNAPGDIMATLAALAFIQDGDVLVTAMEGHLGCASAGDRVCGMARNAGAVALISDGAARDVPGIKDAGLPMWCRGVTPNSPYTNGPGSVGLPIEIAGRHVETGDMVIGDQDGVVAVPFADIDAVIERLPAIQKLEAELDARVADGLKAPPSVADWLKDPAITRIVA